MNSATNGVGMRVSNIRWMSVSAEEAEVEVTDGNYSCTAFCHPCRINVGEVIDEPLHAFNIKDAKLSEQFEIGIWAIDEKSLGRKVVARLIDVSEQVVVVGGIRLIVDDPLPGGLGEGNMVEFECARIDLW